MCYRCVKGVFQVLLQVLLQVCFRCVTGVFQACYRCVSGVVSLCGFIMLN